METPKHIFSAADMDDQTKALDTLVTELVSTFDTDVLVRRFLFAQPTGFHFDNDDPRYADPKHISEISYVVFPRKICGIMRTYLKLILDGLWSEELPEGLQRLEDNMEVLRDRLKRNPNILQVARDYEKNLDQAMYEFNRQMIVGLIDRRKIYGVHFGLSDEFEDLYERVHTAHSEAGSAGLDSYYYNLGRRHFGSSTRQYEELSKSELGRMLLLKEEDVQKYLSMGSRRTVKEDSKPVVLPAEKSGQKERTLPSGLIVIED